MGDLKTEIGYNKHIYCYESREHVLSYTTKGVHCSDPKCVVNSNNKIPTVESSDIQKITSYEDVPKYFIDNTDLLDENLK